MIRSAVLALLMAAGAAPALATEWISCSDAGGAASFDFLVGTVDVLSVVGLTITAGEKVWASAAAYGPGEPVSIGQGFEDTESIRIDAMDADFVKIAELRLFKAGEGDEYVTAGTLRMPGIGAWAVSCTGP